MKRRNVLAGMGGLAAAALAGCLGAVGMDVHEASPAGVDPEVRADTGYEQTGVQELVVEETFEVSGYSEEVVVTNYVTEHDREVDLGPLGSQRAAVFVVLSTPQVSLAGRDFNPVEDMDAEELIGLVEENYDSIENVRHDTDEEVVVLDQETTNARFEADAQFDGRDVPVYVHITEAVQTAEDHLVTIGVYPQEVHDDEDENVKAMMEGVVPEVGSDGGGDENAGEDTSQDGEDGGESSGSDGDGSDGGDEDGQETDGGGDEEEDDEVVDY